MKYCRNFSTFIIIFLLYSIDCLALEYSNSYEGYKVEAVQKYQVELSESLIKETGGFYTGIGSGLEFSKKLNNGNLEFFALSDRGPNFPVKEGEIILFYPKFSPKIVRIELQNNIKAEVKDFLSIKHQGREITGFNLNKSTNDEKVYDANLKQLSLSFGLDTESLSILKDGNFIVSDEYGPSLNIVDNKTGEIIKRLTPGKGLPENFAKKNFNKGIEAVTVAPNGKIYAVLEGVLNIESNSVKTAKLIRMLELDLRNDSYRVFAYAFDYDKYKDSSKVKIGDIAAIDNENFLVVEQGSAIDGNYRNVIYKLNIKNATDINKLMLSSGKELEFGDLDDLKEIKFVNKKFVLNPREHGWKEDKLEGLTLIDKSTIAITNDNDFALEGLKIEDATCANLKEKLCKRAIPLVNKEKLKTNLWIFKFQQDL